MPITTQRLLTKGLLAMLTLTLAGQIARAAEPVKLDLTGNWSVRLTQTTVDGKSSSATLEIKSPETVVVTAQKYDRLPVYNTNASGWTKGAKLRGVCAQECTTKGLLFPDSLELRAGATPDALRYEVGKDYVADFEWGTVGRLAGGRIGSNNIVCISYRHSLLRLDSIILNRTGKVEVRTGKPQTSAPMPPTLAEGERCLANVWIPGNITALTTNHLFPVLETHYPEPPKPDVSVAEMLLPKTLKKLREGTPLRILAWGDSVTVGTFVPEPEKNRWQAQFVTRLQKQFPQAKIELVTEAWGGRNTSTYLAEPPGSLHNYQEKVLGARADLIVSEFVNDAGLKPAQVEERYAKLLTDMQGINAEWIILTPHYIRPDWMGLTSEREVDEDPRPYVAGLREFTARHKVALADAALRYGHLWRQGIPHSSLLMNAINHPDPRGMKLFADSLMALFP